MKTLFDYGAPPKQIGIVPTAKESQEKKNPVSLRMPASLVDEIEEAERATGADQTELITACVQKSLHAVVDEILKSRVEAQQAWIKKHRPHQKN